jgi:hypothetical protein
MNPIEPAIIYQLRIYVKGVSPMVWRRILVRGDTTIADLHEIMQILMNWYDVHLHHFLIRGKQYGIGRIGTMGFMDNPYKITLDHFQLRLNETFIYAYNYFDDWQLRIRVEAKPPFDPQRFYPYCSDGKRSAPLEDCGGAECFIELKQHYSPFFILERLQTIFSDPNLEENRWDYQAEFERLNYWLNIDRIDRQQINQQLKEQFAVPEENI